MREHWNIIKYDMLNALQKKKKNKKLYDLQNNFKNYVGHFIDEKIISIYF